MGRTPDPIGEEWRHAQERVVPEWGGSLHYRHQDLARRWGPINPDGSGGIRVNCLRPGKILMPGSQEAFDKEPGLKEDWEGENAMGRLADMSEFKGAVLFRSSKASSFMTGSNLVIDGGRK